MKLWINITTEEGELLERFPAVADETSAIIFARHIRGSVERRFATEEEPRPGEKVFTMKVRPVSLATLPPGMVYDLTALPRDFSEGFHRPDLKRSRHPYGEFRLSPEPSADQMEHFGIRELAKGDRAVIAYVVLNSNARENGFGFHLTLASARAEAKEMANELQEPVAVARWKTAMRGNALALALMNGEPWAREQREVFVAKPAIFGETV